MSHIETFSYTTRKAIKDKINEYAKTNGLRVVSISTLYVEGKYEAFVAFEPIELTTQEGRKN